VQLGELFGGILLNIYPVGHRLLAPKL